MRRMAFIVLLASGCLLAQDRPGADAEGFVQADGGSNGTPDRGWADIAAGYSRICALHSNGSLWCGLQGSLERIDGESYTAIGGYDFDGLCAVRDDGALLCGLDGLDDIAFELDGTFVAVSGTASSGCGLRNNGDARCWPDGNAVSGPFSSVGAGDRFACGIGKSTRAVSCWDIDDLTFEEALDDAPGGSYAQVVTADHVGCALGTSGSVRCWGYDFYETVWGPPTASYAQIWLSDHSGCAVRRDGRAVCWGENAGDPNHAELSPPADLAFAKIAVGEDFGCGITTTGAIECWGDAS